MGFTFTEDTFLHLTSTWQKQKRFVGLLDLSGNTGLTSSACDILNEKSPTIAPRTWCFFLGDIYYSIVIFLCNTLYILVYLSLCRIPITIPYAFHFHHLTLYLHPTVLVPTTLLAGRDIVHYQEQQ